MPIRRRDEPLLAELRRGAPCAPDVPEYRFTIRWYESIEKDEVTHPVCDMLERAGHDEPAVGEAQQRDLIQILIEDVVDDIADMCTEIDRRARQVCSFTETGK